jgi:hypothetical protein
MFFVAVNFFYAQKSTEVKKACDVANMRLQNVKIEAQSIERLFTKLSLSYDIPIGLEVATNDDELATYSIDFKEGNLSDLLNQIIRDNSQYDWEIKDGVVNVFPKAGHRVLFFRELLETKISHFSIKEKTNCWLFVENLIATPEVKNILEINSINYSKRSFTGFYIPQLGENFVMNVSDSSLKSILNKVIKESPTAKIWLIKRYSHDPQTFFITVNARHSDFPMKNGEPSFPKIDF